MPSETYDNTWVGAKGPDASDTFLTSSQCLGCHDAGSTGLQFDMTKPNPHGDGLINLSPLATWRTSPMGLGGRDPIFFAQLASETQSFHPKMSGVVQDVCLGCHGIAGERQFHIDEKARSGKCEPFSRDMVDATPWPAGNPSAAHANYGMLARDGITCTSCHRMVLNSKASEPLGDAAAERLRGGAPGAAQSARDRFCQDLHRQLHGRFARYAHRPLRETGSRADAYGARHQAGPRRHDHELRGLRDVPHGSLAGSAGRPTPWRISTSRRPIRNGRSAPIEPAAPRTDRFRWAPAPRRAAVRAATCRRRNRTDRRR